MGVPFRYLHQEHLTGFDQYKYCSVDDSPLSTYVTHPFWEKCVQVRFVTFRLTRLEIMPGLEKK